MHQKQIAESINVEHFISGINTPRVLLRMRMKKTSCKDFVTRRGYEIWRSGILDINTL